MATVVLVGTLDTKGVEYGFLRDRCGSPASKSCSVDAGVLGEPQIEPDVRREEVARAAGADHASSFAPPIAAPPVTPWGAGGGGARAPARRGAPGRPAAVGGSGNSSIAAQAMRDLPWACRSSSSPPVASGDTRPYVGATDVTMMYSVVDISGINQISSRILTNAAARSRDGEGERSRGSGERPLVGRRCSASPPRA
jgi:uncharacterized protein (UPF0261 family)